MNESNEPLLKEVDSKVIGEDPKVTQEDGDTGNYRLGIQLKKDVSSWNLFAIFFSYFVMTSLGGYINVQIVYLLRDPTYFAIDEDHQGRVTSKILLTAIICGLICSCFAGYIYDVFLRKKPFFIAGILGAVFLVITPHTAPSILWLTVIRCLIMVSQVTIQCSPLVMDYIKEDSRGKGLALQNIGNLIGEAFAMTVLFGYSKQVDVSQDKAFCMAAICIACLSFFFLCLVKDPKIKKASRPLESGKDDFRGEEMTQVATTSINAPYEEAHGLMSSDIPMLSEDAGRQVPAPQDQAELSAFDKVSQISRLVFAQCKENNKYVVCFWGATIVRLVFVLFSNFMLLWVTSFVDEGLIDERQSKGIYQMIVLASMIGTIVLVPALGWIADKLPSAVIIPIIFTLRAICAISFIWLDDPTSWLTSSIACALIIFSAAESISIEVLLMRGMPSEIRGTMMGVFAFFGQIGTLFFTLVGGQMFDRIDRSAPFVFLSVMDVLLIIYVLALVALGKFRSK